MSENATITIPSSPATPTKNTTQNTKLSAQNGIQSPYLKTVVPRREIILQSGQRHGNSGALPAPFASLVKTLFENNFGNC